MDAEERFHQKRLGYFKCCIHTRHKVPLVQIKMNRLTRHVSVDGEIVIRTCANGSLKYLKPKSMQHWKMVVKKTRRNDCEQSNCGNQTPTGRDDYV